MQDEVYAGGQGTIHSGYLYVPLGRYLLIGAGLTRWSSQGHSAVLAVPAGGREVTLHQAVICSSLISWSIGSAQSLTVHID